MRVVGTWCLLMAWTALLLPWQRCADDHHDHLVSAVVEHECHHCPCEHGHDDHEEADHAEVEFDSVVQIVVVALAPLDARSLDRPLESAGDAGATAPAVAEEPPVPRTTVLLL
jgi:hypothetical protein